MRGFFQLEAIQDFCKATKEYCPPGRAGLKGEAGLPGQSGLKGQSGRRGRPGAKGAAGHQGRVGMPGPRGPKGENGIPGKRRNVFFREILNKLCYLGMFYRNARFRRT